MTKTTIPGIQYKSVDTQARLPEAVDLGNGMIEAIVSITNMEDNVKDIILPGAYEKSLKTRTPKGVWHHSWTDPIAKTHEIKELLPGDPLLPDTLPDGKPWPADAGALYVKMEFNLNTDKGRNAYEDVKFFGDSQEWSIGYKVGEGKAYKKNGIRHIEELDLYEYSPVLFGAMSSARTTTVKNAQLAYKSLIGGETPARKKEDRIMASNQAYTEVKNQMAAFADQFYKTVQSLSALMDEHKSDERQEVLDLVEEIGLAPEDISAFHESVDDGDQEVAEEKALHLMHAVEAKGGEQGAIVLDHLAMELKSLEDDLDDDEDDEEYDEDYDYEDEDDEEDYDDASDDSDSEESESDAEGVKSLSISEIKSLLQ